MMLTFRFVLLLQTIQQSKTSARKLQKERSESSRWKGGEKSDVTREDEDKIKLSYMRFLFLQGGYDVNDRMGEEDKEEVRQVRSNDGKAEVAGWLGNGLVL
jgi:hypothetical protein